MVEGKAKGKSAWVAAFLGLAPSAFAQCAMCYQNASAQSAKGIAAINQGIVVLALPLVAVVAGIAWVAYQRREAGGSDEERSPQ